MTRQNINLTGLLIFIIVVIIIGRNIDIARAQSHAGVGLKTSATYASHVGMPDVHETLGVSV